MNFIYALRDPITSAIRYVGKSKNCSKRLEGHINAAKNPKKNHHCARWIRELSMKGHKPTIEVLYVVPDGEDWKAAEMKCIAEHLAAGHLLLNMTMGGEGFGDLSPEALATRRANVSAGLLKAWERPEYRSRHLSGLLAAFSDPMVRGKMSEKAKLRSNRPDDKLKNAKAQKAAWARKKASMSAEEYKKYCSDCASAQWSDPVFKARHLAELQAPDVKARRYATRDTPEGIARRSAKLKAAWADPEARARRLAVMRSPEHKAKMSEATKAAYQRPEAKANLARAMEKVRARQKALQQQSEAA